MCCVEVEARVINLCSFQLRRLLTSVSVLNVLHIALVSVLRLWSRLGHSWLLQHCLQSVGLGFSQAVDHYLNQEEDG